MKGRADGGGILSMDSQQDLVFLQGKGGRGIDFFHQVIRVRFRKVRRQIAAEDDRRIHHHVDIFHCECQMIQIVFPDPDKLGGLFFS